MTLGKGGPAYSKSALAAWIPVKVQGMLRLSDLSSVESFCLHSSRIMSPSDEPVDAVRLEDGGGKTLISSFEGRWRAERPTGSGGSRCLDSTSRARSSCAGWEWATCCGDSSI